MESQHTCKDGRVYRMPLGEMCDKCGWSYEVTEIEQLRAELAAVIKERDELVADAKRYRWLRDQELPDIQDCYHQHPDRFDEAVDAALAKAERRAAEQLGADKTGEGS